MAKVFEFTPYSKLLTREQLETISGNAARLYAVVWNRMKYRQATVVTLSDAEAMDHGRIEAAKLESAKAELNHQRLIHIETMGRSWGRYAFVFDQD